jgi:hypothetical protein
MTEGHHSGPDAQAAQGPGHSLWQACLDQLAQELPEQQFNTWIKPLSAQVAPTISHVLTVLRGQPLQAGLGAGPVRRRASSAILEKTATANPMANWS